MKKLLSLFTATAIILTSTNTNISAGSGMSSTHSAPHSAPSSTRSMPRYPDLQPEIITAIQNSAVEALHAYTSGIATNLVESSALPYIDRSFHGTAYNLENTGARPSGYIYIPCSVPISENIIITFIPASNFLRSRKPIRLQYEWDVNEAIQSGLGIYTDKTRIDDQITDIYGKILEKINSNEYDAPRFKDTFVGLHRLLNKWHLMDLLDDELQKLIDNNENIDNFGFLVIEITDSTTTPENPSPSWNINGPSTFHVTTIATPRPH